VGVSMPPSMAIPAFETKRSTPMPLARRPLPRPPCSSRVGCWPTRDLRHHLVHGDKHVSIGLTEWLAATDVDQGIGVSVLCPAAVRTPILAGKEDTPEGRDARSAPTNSPTWSSRGLQPQPA
jgi:hypothetical protein